MDYAARLMVLLVWMFLIFTAIKIMPVRKWAVVAIALLPIAVQQSVSISADALSVAPASLFMAILIRSFYENRKASARRDLLFLATLACVATLAKPVMIVLLILIPFYNYQVTSYIIVWRRRFKTESLLKLCAVLAPAVLYMVWGLLASLHNAGVSDIYYLAGEHSELLKNSPKEEITLFIKQAYHFIFYGFSLDEFGAFKWFSSSIPQTWRFLGVAGLIMILLTRYNEHKRPLGILTKSRCIRLNIATLIAAIGIIAANILTLFIIWTPLNAFAVEGVQFRYFLPAFFVLACFVELHYITASERFYRNFVLINSSVMFVVSILTLGGVV